MPQCRSGGGPWRAAIAAAAAIDEQGCDRGSADWSSDAKLSRAKRLAKNAVRRMTRAMLRTYGPGCDGSIIDAKAARIPDEATWIDLEEPTRGRRSARRAMHQGRCADPRRDGRDRAVQPPLRTERRALHDGQRALRRRGTAPDAPLRSASCLPKIGWSRSAMQRPSRSAPSKTMRGASPSWSVTGRRHWSGCSTQSSTGWRTKSSGSARRWKISHEDLPEADGGAPHPGRRG